MDRAEIYLNTVRWSRTKAANRVEGRATTDGSAVRMSQEWAARSTTPGRPPWTSHWPLTPNTSADVPTTQHPRPLDRPAPTRAIGRLNSICLNLTYSVATPYVTRPTGHFFEEPEHSRANLSSRPRLPRPPQTHVERIAERAPELIQWLRVCN